MKHPLPLDRSLWPLPCAAALLPLLATAIAYTLAIRLDLAPACNPFIEGCVSISRAARYELPNILFRALMLPAAVLQALCWLLCPAWLRTLHATPDRWQRLLPWLGVIAAVCLVLYGTFLGTDGPGYRFMRRYGTTFYFGFTCIGMLIVSGEMQRLVRAERKHRHVTAALLGLCAALPLLGLTHVFVPLALPGEAAKDTLENATEWWGGAIFTVFFLVLAWGWRETGFAARLIGNRAG
jgi:formate-dependent nitrite reductase membrane component NrfD